jgi:hypothetical protein
MEFQQKYLKYKEKYLELKKMKAGQYRYMPRGPMIGYPAVPYMSPQVRVTGPIPGPMPFPIGLPGPMLVGPRFVRVTEEHKCPSCAGPASYKLYAVFDKKSNLGYYLKEDLKVLILDTPDKKYRDEVQKSSTLSIRPVYTSGGEYNKDIKLTFKFKDKINLLYDSSDINHSYTGELESTPKDLSAPSVDMNFTLVAEN